MTTDEIDEFVHNETIAANAYPSPLRYAMFPKSVCTSVNNVACHGIPDDRPLVDGDIINIDITVSGMKTKNMIFEHWVEFIFIVIKYFDIDHRSNFLI